MFYFIFLFDDFGIATYLTREVSRNREGVGTYFVNSLVLKGILILVSVVFLWIYLVLFPVSHMKMWVVTLFGVYGLFFSFNQLCYATYRAFEKMEYEMSVQIIEKILIVGLGIFALYHGYGLVTLAAIYGGVSLISLSINLFWTKRQFLHQKAFVDFTLLKTILKGSILLGIFMFLAQAHARLDVLMLSAMKNDQVVGWYAAPFKLILVLEVIPTILVTSTFPRMARVFKESREQLVRVYTIGMKYLTYFILPMIVGTLFLSDQIIFMLVGEAYVKSITPLRILIFAGGFNFLNIFLGGVLMASNHHKDLVILQISAVTLNVTLNAILIPGYGHNGAAIATLVSYGLVLIVAGILVSAKVCKLQGKRFLFKTVLATLVMALFLYWFQLALVPAITMAVLVYGLMLFLFKGIVWEEILLIRKPGEFS